MSNPKYSYDPACETLAEHFLADKPSHPLDKCELAQVIQDAVESWFDREPGDSGDPWSGGFAENH